MEVYKEVEVVVKSANDQYWDGFQAYMDYVPYVKMMTSPERRGWQAALDADAECHTPGYLATMEHNEEVDWNRRGGWL
jgi:hypothetical protein